MSILDQTADKVSKIVDIDSISVKETLFDGKVTVAKEDYDSLTVLAKKTRYRCIS